MFVNTFRAMVLLFCILLFSSKANALESCFIASMDGMIITEQGDLDQYYPPCSTFKIAISLMGFDSGILVDEKEPVWVFTKGYVDWLKRWRQPHDPKLWLANSCVWYSQKITKKLGIEKFSEYVRRFNYGNQDTSGDRGENNGLTNCWLSSSLSISPRQQLDFLNKLVANRLPVSIKAQEITKKIMYQETFENGWDLYGKTGSGYQLDVNGNRLKDRQVGWFIGFICKDEQVMTFVYLIADEKSQYSYASLRARAACKDAIRELILNDANI